MSDFSAVVIVCSGSQMFSIRALCLTNKYRFHGWHVMDVYGFWETWSPKISTVQRSNSSGRMQFFAKPKLMCCFQLSFPEWFTVHSANHQSRMYGIMISHGAQGLCRNWSRASALCWVLPRFHWQLHPVNRGQSSAALLSTLLPQPWSGIWVTVFSTYITTRLQTTVSFAVCCIDVDHWWSLGVGIT